MDLKELGRVNPDSHWYYQSKVVPLKRAVRRWAPAARRILDVGAGSAFFSRALIAGSANVTAVCVDPNYESEHSEDGDRVSLVRTASPDMIAAADVMLFIDVLEHVYDDAALLHDYARRLRPGALVLVTVPAFMSLWSAHDEFLQHVRRYRTGEVVRLIEAEGLEVLHRQYLFGSIFPVAWLVRRVRRRRAASSDLRPVTHWVNSLLRTVLSAEHRLRWNRLAGLSVFVVARVRGSAPL